MTKGGETTEVAMVRREGVIGLPSAPRLNHASCRVGARSRVNR